MKIRISALFVIAITLMNCATQPKQETITMKKDPHSYAKPNEAQVKHLSWKASVDFDLKKITGVATWTIEHDQNAKEITFDSKGLAISKVTLDNGIETQF